MAEGPGKYDEACSEARRSTKAVGVLLVVLEGEHGSGFSAQLPHELRVAIPATLRSVADQIERDMQDVPEEMPPSKES